MGRSSKPICNSCPPGLIEGGGRLEDLGAGERAQGCALQDRQPAVDRGRPVRPSRRHEREIVREVSVGVEAVPDEEEADTLSVGRGAEIDGVGGRGHVERVVEQDTDVADRAVGLHLVEAEAVGEGAGARLRG